MEKILREVIITVNLRNALITFINNFNVISASLVFIYYVHVLSYITFLVLLFYK